MFHGNDINPRATIQENIKAGVIVVPCFVRAADLWVFHSLNPSTDFHQIFRVYLPQEGLELIRFWGYLVTTVAMATLLRFFGL